MMTSMKIEQPHARLAVSISEAIIVCQFDEAADAGQCRIHPRLECLPGGRLVATANIDGDIGGAERLAYASDDGGSSWHEDAMWPADAGAFAVLSTGEALLTAGNLFYATDEPGVYCLPVRRSRDSGLTWGTPEATRVELPLPMEEPLDLYDPPAEFLERDLGGQCGRDYLAKWQKPRPGAAEAALRAQFGCRTLRAWLMQIVPLTGECALAFLYLSPAWGAPAVTVCLVTEDGGRRWTYRSTPGRYDTRFAAHGYLRHALDGLCEPCCTRLASGELYLVMRLGSFHPLYATCSNDEGRTWAPQADLRPGCYYAGWPARPLAIYGILPTVVTLPDGTLALCTGRPDVTLSFSLDNGYHWPWTCRFLEDNKPEEQGTYNNTMVQVSPNRLLLLYDQGGYHRRPPEFTGVRRIVGHMIDVEVSPR